MKIKTFTYCLLFAVTLSVTTTLHAQPPKATPAVRVEKVGSIDATQPKNYVGTVRSKETVNIVPRVSGYLDKVAFQEGATVKKGDLLFEIEDRLYQTNVKVAQSVVRQIKAEIALAERDIQRTKTLHKDKVVSEQELDQAQRTIALQKAKLDEAEANLEQAQIDLSYTKIYSPITGRIGEKCVSEGNYITPNSGILATIVQYDPIRVKFSMSESDYLTHLQNDDALSRTKLDIICANNTLYDGAFQMEFLDNLVDIETGTITLFLVCDNPGNVLLPGGYVKVAMSERFDAPMPAVNVTALMRDGSANYVYVLGEQNKIQRRDVELGNQVYDKQVVRHGLNVDELVVTGGLNKVRQGDTVKPVFTKAPGMELAQKAKSPTPVAETSKKDAKILALAPGSDNQTKQ